MLTVPYITPVRGPRSGEVEVTLRHSRPSGGLAGPGVISADLVSVYLSRPTAGPPAAVRLRVEREQRGIFAAGTSSTKTSVRAVDAQTGRTLSQAGVPMSATLWNLGRHDAEGEAMLVLPAAISASRRIYLTAIDADGTEIGRSAAFSIANLMGQGNRSPLVEDDRSLGERVADLSSAGADRMDAALWIGGAVAAALLLASMRR